MGDPRQIYQSAVDAIGLFAALLMIVIYLYLSRRAAKAGKVSGANFVLAGCVITWTVLGLIGAAMDFVPPPAGPAANLLVHAARVLEHTFALVWMIPVLSIWKDELSGSVTRRCIRLMQSAILITAGILLYVHLRADWDTTPQPLRDYRIVQFRTAFVSLALPLLAAGFFFLSRRPASPVARLSLHLILLGTLGLTLSMLLRNVCEYSSVAGLLLNAVTVWCPLIIITGVIVLLARFRFADRFIRHCVRIVSAGTVGIVAVTVVAGIAPPWAAPAFMTGANPGLLLIAAGIFIFLLLLLYGRLEAGLNLLVDRYIFPAPDYDHLMAAFQDRQARLDEDQDVVQAAGDFIAATLQMRNAAVCRLSKDQCSILAIPFVPAPGAFVIDSRAPEGGAFEGIEVLAPFRLNGDGLLEAIAVEPGAARRGLVTHEMGFIRGVASHLAGRLQALLHQRSLIESRSRESQLQQQVVAAELQALRAQINPHFLFNALNTLAALIAIDPAGAETMTLRLAEVFRYVLAHSSRSTVSVREEIDFLRSYLHIEQARFGDRLEVSIVIDPAVNALPIPSLVLQPVVENALKHGLAPKPGPGHLRIEARIAGDLLCITIEDDGMGLSPAFPGRNPALPGQGVGLINIRRRLETQYGGKARLVLEPRDPSGVRAVLELPLPSISGISA